MGFFASLRRGVGRIHATESAGASAADEIGYRDLVHGMSDAIARCGVDGNVLFVSLAAEKLFGCALSDLRGQGLFARVRVGDRPAYLTALNEAAVLREGSAAEFRARRGGAADSAAGFVWIEMRCGPLSAPVHDSREGRCETVAVLRDVSERKNAEQGMLDAQTGAERANAAKTRFLATMSHELRTPLNAIIGFSEMLLQEKPLLLDAARRAEYAALINESGHHLLSVVNGILDVSKIETGNFELMPEPFAPAQAVVSCCELVGMQAERAGIIVERNIAADLPLMIADKRAVSQILINLLSNAIRFSERGGAVTISGHCQGADIIFVVADNGSGIGDGDLERLGEPYFQARASDHRRHSGTGLGLSIVKGLVRLHGGDIRIKSRLDEGTRVTVRLPLDCEGARKAAQPLPMSPAVKHSAMAAGTHVRKSA